MSQLVEKGQVAAFGAEGVLRLWAETLAFVQHHYGQSLHYGARAVEQLRVFLNLYHLYAVLLKHDYWLRDWTVAKIPFLAQFVCHKACVLGFLHHDVVEESVELWLIAGDALYLHIFLYALLHLHFHDINPFFAQFGLFAE